MWVIAVVDATVSMLCLFNGGPHATGGHQGSGSGLQMVMDDSVSSSVQMPLPCSTTARVDCNLGICHYNCANTQGVDVPDNSTLIVY